MGEFFSSIFHQIRYVRFVYAALLAAALWGALRTGPRRSAKPVVVALLALLLLSWPPVGWLLNAALESPFRHASDPPANVEAIVLFSGGRFSPEINQPFTYLANGSVLRCRTAARIHAAAGRPPIVVCGPATDAGADSHAVWDLMSRQLEMWGVPANRIRIEPHGHSTYEQAQHAAELLRAMGAHRIAIVTEGFHMRRALGCLRRQGFETFPAMAGSRGFPEEIAWRDFLPNSDTVGVNEEALREILAVAVYKARGRM